MRNKKGFTLIEVIIVIVIIGIMATLALPRITGQLNSSQAAEAMQMFGALRRSAMNCFDVANATTNTLCDTWAELGMTAPSANSKFTYQVDTATAGNIAFRAMFKADNTQALCMSINNATGDTAYTYLGTVFAGTATRLGGAAGCAAGTYAAIL
ncbi:MAG: prepilin-type N-terminal cleavage/methylation domain-containing protein [Candidatus Omnitrophica bacterium]|nr:prepilin-type N-terminal cleavage/methylation domain-containing protein [Candidatus Omnitrophota bacterium]